MFLTLNFENAGKNYLKKLEDDPDAVVLLGDSAYHRSTKKRDLGLGLPVPLSDDGIQPKVSFLTILSCGADIFTSKGDDIAASHKVQSVRAVVEQTIGDLKIAKVMEGNKISSSLLMSKVLDCVIGLHNFRVLRKADPNFIIKARLHAIPGEHIFHPVVPENDVDLHIPKDAPNLEVPEHVHIRGFRDFLPSAAPGIKKAVDPSGAERVFPPTVQKRGRNLYNGAYVLQLQVQDEGLDVWTVKYCVGASYSYEIHYGYVEMSRESAVRRSICDCYSGYVISMRINH